MLSDAFRQKMHDMMKHVCILLTALSLAAYSNLAASDETLPKVRLETSAGNIDIELYPAEAPQTVGNFLQLVDDNFYENLVFHRVAANFVIQAGGYDAKLNYRDPPRTVVNESLNGLSNSKGTIAMARTSDPDSADTQFFINVKHNGQLDGAPGRPGYTVFGMVIDGMDVVVDIELSDTHLANGMAGVPTVPITIHRATRL